MQFVRHKNLEGKHAYLSPSNYHWLNYSEEKFYKVFANQLAKERGVKLHALACECIKLGVKLPDTGETLNTYVNDAIDFGLFPEVTLYYSENCFGTADTIGHEPGVLRISDLKTGVNKAYMHQLEIYAALFFLEYAGMDINVYNTDVELRIYQSGECWLHKPPANVIEDVITRIIERDEQINRLKGDLTWENKKYYDLSTRPQDSLISEF